jgi:carbonic anhydrase
MKNSRKPVRLTLKISAFLPVLLLLFASFSQPFAQQGSASADAARRLKEGNERYLAGKQQAKDYTKDRQAVAETQQPYAIVLACSDSRLSPEILFDESLGHLFVVRNAGNVIEPVALGSIEYAVEHLQSKLLLILGHESCGAVKATIAGGDVSPNLEEIVERITPAVEIAKHAKLNEQETLNMAIRENVLLQADHALEQSKMLKELVQEHKLEIICGVYNLHTGKVDFFPPRAGTSH